MKLLGAAFSSIEVYNNGKICIMSLDRNSFESSYAKNEDVEDIVELSMSINNIEIGI